MEAVQDDELYIQQSTDIKIKPEVDYYFTRCTYKNQACQDERTDTYRYKYYLRTRVSQNKWMTI